MANHSIPQIKLKRIRAGYYLTHYNYKSYYIEHMGNGDWTWSQFDAAPDDIHRTKKDAVIALRHYLATQPPPLAAKPRPAPTLTQQQSDWDRLPDMKMALRWLEKMGEYFELYQQSEQQGKLSPEGARFLARKCNDLATRLTDWAYELKNGSAKS